MEAVLALSLIQKNRIVLQEYCHELQIILVLEDETILTTNNSSEQALRWSTVVKEVTNGFRSEWGGIYLLIFALSLNTGKRQDLSAFESILTALNSLESLFRLSLAITKDRKLINIEQFKENIVVGLNMCDIIS